MSILLEAVRLEIVELHAFFVDWFNGTVAREELQPRFLSRLDPDVVFISPEGRVIALETGTVKPSSLERVTVDTTVQPKAIAHPTDSKLYLKALLTLVGQAALMEWTVSYAS